MTRDEPPPHQSISDETSGKPTFSESRISYLIYKMSSRSALPACHRKFNCVTVRALSLSIVYGSDYLRIDHSLFCFPEDSATILFWSMPITIRFWSSCFALKLLSFIHISQVTERCTYYPLPPLPQNITSTILKFWKDCGDICGCEAGCQKRPACRIGQSYKPEVE